MDDSRDFDPGHLMEQMRLKVRDNRRSTGADWGAAMDEAADTDELQRDLGELNSAYDLGRVSLDPKRRVLGWTILTAAKMVSNLLRPIIRRQSEYNAANTRLTNYLKSQLERLRSQLREIRAHAERAAASNIDDYRAQTQALTRRLARIYGDDIAMHGQALSDLSRRLAVVEAAVSTWSEQFSRLDAIEQRHRELSRELRQELDRNAGAADSQRRQEQERFESLSARSAELSAAVAALTAAVAELTAAVAAARASQSQAEAQARSHFAEFSLIRERVARAERRLRRLFNPVASDGLATLQSASPPPSQTEAEIDYAGFEDRLRESQTVKEQQRGYVKYFAGMAPVIDAGCGKGEFLELMREAGIEAKGLDLDLDMVLLCREKGLDVERCDAIGYLERQPDASVGGIFSAQVIEHLTSAQLSALISLSWRKLVPGGVVVLETLNPESLFVHYKWFWMDPSHVRLVHPQTLQFLLESAGFSAVSCHFASPPVGAIPIPPLQAGANGATDDFNRATDYLNKLIYGDQEYFVVARK